MTITKMTLLVRIFRILEQTIDSTMMANGMLNMLLEAYKVFESGLI